jgi:hypothetical protein
VAFVHDRKDCNRDYGYSYKYIQNLFHLSFLLGIFLSPTEVVTSRGICCCLFKTKVRICRLPILGECDALRPCF